MYLRNLARFRKKQKLTQEGLARKANISYHTIIKLERGGIKNPKIATVAKLAKALNIGIDQLLEGYQT